MTFWIALIWIVGGAGLGGLFYWVLAGEYAGELTSEDRREVWTVVLTVAVFWPLLLIGSFL